MGRGAKDKIGFDTVLGAKRGSGQGQTSYATTYRAFDDFVSVLEQGINEAAEYLEEYVTDNQSSFQEETPLWLSQAINRLAMKVVEDDAAEVETKMEETLDRIRVRTTNASHIFYDPQGTLHLTAKQETPGLETFCGENADNWRRAKRGDWMMTSNKCPVCSEKQSLFPECKSAPPSALVRDDVREQYKQELQDFLAPQIEWCLLKKELLKQRSLGESIQNALGRRYSDKLLPLVVQNLEHEGEQAIERILGDTGYSKLLTSKTLKDRGIVAPYYERLTARNWQDMIVMAMANNTDAQGFALALQGAIRLSSWG